MTTKYKLFTQYLDYYKRKNSLTKKDFRNIIDYSNHDFYGITPFVPTTPFVSNTPFVPQTSLDILADVASKYELWQKENEIEIESPVQPKTKVFIDSAIHTISDLITIIEKYQVSDAVEYNIDVKMLNRISSELRDLDALVGLKSLKKNVLDQILYFSQGLAGPGEYKHMVIYGSPGTGKTDIAKILGRLYANMGILGAGSTLGAGSALGAGAASKSGSFRKATRSDLVAGYLGQTAIKTKTLVGESLGGALFIDEIYSLGDDSFSKECADTLCELLSDHKDNLIVIVAGYQNEVNDRFFRLNAGLESRFTWRFTIDDYTSAELWKMFKNKISAIGWTHNIQDGTGEDWFKRKYADFPAFGRDIEALIFKVKIAHSRRVYGKTEQTDLKTILVADLDAGFLQFKESMKSSTVYSEKKFVSSMFL
jgi:SpoVK/Ycf46/Vps4 family AAA+-type ATPase